MENLSESSEAEPNPYPGNTTISGKFTFENFQETEHNRAALKACREFNPGKENLYIFGPTGSGKTHLCFATIKAIRQRERLKDYFFVRHLTKILREIRACEEVCQEQEIIDSFVIYSGVVLDDLGVEKFTEFAATILYELIDGRYMKNPTGLIVSSNLSLGQLAGKLGDDRVPSRLSQMCRVISLTGEKDWRLDRGGEAE